MSITINWANTEHTALNLTFIAPWTWDEYEAISNTIQAMFDSTFNEVDLIIDIRHAGHIPEYTLSELRDAYAEGTSNLGQYIFVGASPTFVQQLAIADHYYTALGGKLEYACVDTLIEAQRLTRWKNLMQQYYQM